MAKTQKEIDNNARASVERSQKISMVYRKQQELDALQEELDSIAVKFNVNKTEAQNKAELVTPLERKIKNAKSVLNKEHRKVINSGDRDLIKDYKKNLSADDYGKKIASSVNYNPSKQSKKNTTMAKTNKRDKIVSDFRENLQAKEDKLAYLEQKDPNSKEYKDLKAEIENGKIISVYQDQKNKEEQYDKDIAEAEKSGNWTRAKELDAEKKSFDKNKVDFGKMTKELEANDAFRYSTREGAQPFLKTGKDILDVNMGKINESFAKSNQEFISKRDAERAASNIEEKTSGSGTRGTVGSGDSGATSGRSEKTQIETRLDKQEGAASDTSDLEKGTTDWAQIAKQRQQEIDDLNSAESEQFQFDYAPDSQSDRDVLGSLMDVGRGAVGMMGAMEEVPTYERGSMWNQAMDESERMRNEGLSADELNYRNQQAEQAYAYNVKNIRRGAGGSAGAYLGNVQSAAAGLYGEYGKTAAIDEGLRRQNRANFQGMAGKDEVINRQIFQDDLSQVLKNKEQGAALVGDAINNIQEREQFRKKYGKDSASYAYKKALTKDLESESFYRDKSNKSRTGKALRELEFERDKALEKSGDVNVIDGAQNDALVKETMAKTEQSSTLDGGTGSGLVNDALSNAKSEAVPTEINAEGKPITGGTVTKTSSSPSGQSEQEIAKANIAKNIKKAEPKKLKKELDVLIDAEQYGGLTKEQEARKNELKGLI
jgi:hypothetical protein